jgi:ketosteroid isomerase-like protein
MSTQPAADEDVIAPYRRAFIQASKTGDVDALISLVEEDVVAMSPNDTTVYGKAEYRSWWEEYFQYFRLTAFEEPERNLVVHGDFAIEHSAYMIAIVAVNGGTRIRDDGRTLTIWRKQPDDSWKMWQTIWNSTKPIGVGTNRYMSRLMQKKARPQR